MLPTKSTPASEFPQLLTIKQVCEILRLTRQTIHVYVLQGRMPPPLKIGRATRWDRRDLEKWINDRCPGLTVTQRD